MRFTRSCLAVLAVFAGYAGSASSQAPAAGGYQAGYNAFNDPRFTARLTAQGLQAAQQRAAERQREAEERARALAYGRAVGDQAMLETMLRHKNEIESIKIRDRIAMQYLEMDLQARMHAAVYSFPVNRGAAFSVPFGSYSGEGLIEITDRVSQLSAASSGAPLHESGRISMARTHSAQVFGTPDGAGGTVGWRFEPAAVLQGQIEVVQTGEQVYVPPFIPGDGVIWTPPPPNTRPCKFAITYRYAGPHGAYTFQTENPAEAFFQLPASIPVADNPSTRGGCLLQLTAVAKEEYWRGKIAPTYRSTNGAAVLDMRNPARPVVRFPDGSTEEMGTGEQSAGFAKLAQYESFFGPAANANIMDLAAWHFDRAYSAKVTDRNGNTTTFRSVLAPYAVPGPNGQSITYANPIARETIVDDAEGRTTRFLRDADGDVREIRAPAPMGRGELVWSLEWMQGSWDPERVMPDVKCYSEALITYNMSGVATVARWPEIVRCAPLAFKTLQRMTLPDGRTYEFDYRLPSGETSWGALTREKGPDGAIHTFTYGGADTPTHWPNSLALPTGRTYDYAYPSFSNELARRRLVESRTYPLGANGASFGTRIVDEGDGWTRSTQISREANGDERIDKSVREVASRGYGPLIGRTVAVEVQDAGGQTVEATYFGYFPGLFTLPVAGLENAGTAMPQRWNDPSATDRMFVTAEAAPAIDANTDPTPLDVRPTHVVHYRDGLAWVEAYTYDRAASGGTRSNGNVTVHRILDAAGSPLLETQTDYVETDSYASRNLTRLPRDTRTYGWSKGAWKMLARTAYGYDEGDLERSNDDRLDASVSGQKVRGNRTTTTTHRVESSDGASDNAPATLAATARYYDNGSVRETVAPGSRVTTVDGDFRSCSSADPIRQTTAWGADTGNPVGRLRTVNRTDCFSGLVLSSLDANGNRTCTQYDRLGRVVEIAVPGDKLSMLADGIRDPDCATSGSSALGSNGYGPTTWTDWRDDTAGKLGQNLGGPDSTHRNYVVWTKNGAGTYVRTFIDGLGRVVQTCDQVDPTTNGGAAEVCSFKLVDESGKTETDYLPYYSGGASDAVIMPPSGLQYTRTELDPLDRPTRVELVNSGTPAVTMAYSNDGQSWISTTTDPAGNDTISGTNILGQTFNVSRRSDLCAGGYCTTLTTFDSAGRPLAIRGPINADGSGGHVTSIEYDGYGRRKSIVDPSLGTHRYQYDAAGNLESETDSKGQSIRYAYDGLNRVVAKSYIDPTGQDRAGERVLRFEYDANGSRGVSNARGRLTAISNDLVRRTMGYDALGRVVSETVDGGGASFTRSVRYGYATRAVNDTEPGNVMLSETRPGNELVSYRYDADSSLVQIDTCVAAIPSTGMTGRFRRSTTPVCGAGESVVRNIKRNVHGDITELTYGNGTVTRYAYDENRSWRLARKSVSGPQGTILDLAFGWDANGNLKSLANARADRQQFGWTFDYDALDQMVGATNGAGQRLGYGYSGTGNILEKGVLVESGGNWSPASVAQAYGEEGANPYAVTRSGNDTFRYDANGNLVATSLSGGLRFVWNAENMPIQTYRGERLRDEKWFLGERLWKKVEVDAQTEAVKTTLYPFGSVQVENGAYRQRFADYAERDPADGRLRFFHRDQVGTANLVTDAAGQVVYEAYHQPYGEDWQTLVGGYDPLRKYSDKEREKNTGFYDYGARLYMPQTGRWASADSIDAGDLADGGNRYHFTSNNPASRYDPDGHKDGRVDGSRWTMNDAERKMDASLVSHYAMLETMNKSKSTYWRDLYEMRQGHDPFASRERAAQVAQEKQARQAAALKKELDRQDVSMGIQSKLMRRVAGTQLLVASTMAGARFPAPFKSVYRRLPAPARALVKPVYSRLDKAIRPVWKQYGTFASAAGIGLPAGKGIGGAMGLSDAMGATDITIMPNFVGAFNNMRKYGIVKGLDRSAAEYLAPDKYDDPTGKGRTYTDKGWVKKD